MKTPLILALVALCAVTVRAADGHDHGQTIAGPRGGKVVEITGGHAEFLVQPDRKASVVFYSEDMKPLAPADQVVAVVAEAPSGKAKLDFEQSADGFVSTSALPEGEGYRIVLQIRQTAEAKAQNFRIGFNISPCGECKLAEYACICPPGAGHGH